MLFGGSDGRGGDMDWTGDQIATLTRLWEEGLTIKEIGRRLHISGSAAVGKAHRLKLRKRPSPIRNSDYAASRARAMVEWHAQGRPLRSAPPKPYAPPRVKPVKQNFPEVVPPPNPADRYRAMGTVNKPCEYPIGDERPYKACGEDRVVGKPFCPDHCAESYIKIRTVATAEGTARHVAALENAAKLEEALCR